MTPAPDSAVKSAASIFPWVSVTITVESRNVTPARAWVTLTLIESPTDSSTSLAPTVVNVLK